MATSQEIQDAIDELIADIALFHSIVQGSASTDVPTEAGLVPSVLKFYASITASITAGIIPGFTVVTQTIPYTVNTTHANNVHILVSSSPLTIIVPAVGAGGFPTKFTLKFYNASSCGQLLSISGYSLFYLYPLQTLILENGGGTWRLSPDSQRWRAPTFGANIFVNPISGSNGNDGLSATTAFFDIQHAWDFITANVDDAGSQANIFLSGSMSLNNVVLATQPLGHHIIGIIGDPTGASPASYL